MKMFFGTNRLTCKPLKDVTSFRKILIEDERIRRYFPIDDVNDFFNSLTSSECFPCEVYRLNTGRNVPLLGYINGYIYSRGELLVEFFITEMYRSQGCGRELLESYLFQCTKIGFHSFRFEVEEDNFVCRNLLHSFGAVAGDSFEDNGRQFSVYKLVM